MTRYRFPQDRLVFRYGAPGTPLYAPQAESLTIFQDATAVTPASILDTNGIPTDNVLDIGPNCLIPEFLGPDGLTTLYARDRVGNISALYAQTGPLLSQSQATGPFAIPNVTSPPAAPASGGVLYVEAGALKYRGQNGTITTIAPA